MIILILIAAAWLVHDWWYSFLQHYLTMFGGTLVVPLILSRAICVEEDSVGTSEIISTVFFVCGLVTLMQVTIGTRYCWILQILLMFSKLRLEPGIVDIMKVAYQC